jgi:ectoine hydroxylase
MRSEYEANGFVFRPSLLDAAEIDVLLGELDRVLLEAPHDERFIMERDGTTVRTIANLHRRSDVYDHLVRHPVLIDVARTLLDDEVYVF